MQTTQCNTFCCLFLLKGDPDTSADWSLKENADGTLQFDSVTSPGVCVCIAQCKNLHMFLLVSTVHIHMYIYIPNSTAHSYNVPY